MLTIDQKQAGIIRRVRGERTRLCSELCLSSFKQDRAMGLIYGPYFWTDPQTGVQRQLRGPGEASMLWKCCAYCGNKLKRARARV
jgi:hypothetical protein